MFEGLRRVKTDRERVGRPSADYLATVYTNATVEGERGKRPVKPLKKVRFGGKDSREGNWSGKVQGTRIEKRRG